MKDDFDPKTAARRFMVGAMYYANFKAIPHLVQILDREAPGIAFHFIPHRDGREAAAMLASGRTDLAVGTLRTLPDELRSQEIAIDRPVCIARHSHPALARGLDLDTFLELPHACISYWADPGEEVDQVLAQQNRKRRIRVTIPNFYSLAVVVQSSNLIAVVPDGVARNLAKHLSIAVYEIPFSMQPLPLLMAWTAEGEHDPALRWLRETIRRAHGQMEHEVTRSA